MQPETRYARLGRDRIAYQVLGEGPPDLVVIAAITVDVVWEDPGVALFLRSLALFSRVILFDRRGSGASDPLPSDPLPPWESHVEELAVVLDEVGSERAAVLAELEATPTAILFAGTKPERISALILVHATAKYLASDDYAIGFSSDDAESVIAQVDQLWGTDAMAAMFVPSRAGDERFRRWLAKQLRAGASPRAAQAVLRAVMNGDVRPLLPSIQAPTLLLHRRDFPFIPIQHARYLVEHLPDGRLVELPGADMSLIWDPPDSILDVIEEFLTGVRRTNQPGRVLATVLFTDIVGSTERATRVGDRRWRELLSIHDQLTRRLVEEFNGQLIQTTGDGILATFDGPGRGIRCAAALKDELRGLGLHIRAGLHTGEVELRDTDVRGIAVHIAARVMTTGGPDEVIISRTVRDLIFGSDITVEDRGVHVLKGIDGSWQLFAVTRP